MKREEWLREFAENERERLAMMKRSLEMFEAGTMHLYHNRDNVSEGHMAFLRKAISDTEVLLKKIEDGDDA